MANYGITRILLNKKKIEYLHLGHCTFPMCNHADIESHLSCSSQDQGILSMQIWHALESSIFSLLANSCGKRYVIWLAKHGSQKHSYMKTMINQVKNTRSALIKA